MGWLQTIARVGENINKKIRPALKVLPALFLLCEVKQRPGLSAIALTTAIIKRLNEIGIETGTNPDGSPNKINQFVRIFSEELVREIKTNAKITCVLEPGTINSVGSGANAGGPVVVNCLNTYPVNTSGILE
nr:MAG TPA: hypothetical protein [Caudoviricetes sp.]